MKNIDNSKNSLRIKRTIIVVLFLYFVQGIVANIGHPITPNLVIDLGVTNMFGIFFALMSLGMAFGGPLWGILGDKYNKKIIISIGLVIYGIGQYAFGNIHNIGWMMFFRFVSGFGVSASITLMLSYLIEHSSPDNKKRNIAFGAAMTALGGSVGYLLGGNLPILIGEPMSVAAGYYAIYQAELIFLIQAIATVALAIVIYFALDDCDPVVNRKKETMLGSLKSIKNVNANLLLFLLSLTLTSIAAINISKYLDVYIADLGYGANGIGNFVFVTGIVGILTTIFIVPLVIKFKKDMGVMIVVNILSAIIIYFVFRTEDLMLTLYTLFMLYIVLKNVYAPFETSYISSHSKEGQYGKIMGIRQFFLAIGFVIGPIVANVLYLIKPIYVFDLSVVMFILALILIMIVNRNIKKEIALVAEEI